MIIGRYRITKKGYVVFGSFGIIIFLLMVLIIKNAFSVNDMDKANVPNSNQVQGNTQTGSDTGTASETASSAGSSETAASDATGTEAASGTEGTGLSVEEKNNILKSSSSIIYFKPDQFELDPSYYSVLSEMVKMANRFKEAKLIINGHYNGYPEYPSTEKWLALAQNRADMVEAYFLSQGINPERIVVNNLGCTVPVNKDESWQELEKNRRVEVYFEAISE